MTFRFIGTLSLIWFAMAVVAQNNPVLDTDGKPLQAGVKYYALPAATDVAGGLTLINRTGSCPLFVGQERLGETVSQGYPITFQPFKEGETVIRESNSFIATFSAASVCVQTTSWYVGERDSATNRRMIQAGEGGRFAEYFMIRSNENSDRLYYIHWCPVDVCPTCRFACGSAGILVENEKRLMALDGPGPFFFQFVKV